MAALVVGGATFVPLATSSAQAAETVSVSSSAQLTAALKSARAGQTITLKDGTYTGKFTGTASGTASAPIKLVGSAKAVLTTGSSSSGYSLYLTGSYWNLSGLTVSKGQKGIVLDNSDNTVIDHVTVQSTGMEAIHLRKGSSNVVVRNSLVQNTGLSTPDYGEGIYIGSAKSNWGKIMGSSSKADKSDNAVIENNRIVKTSAEGIDIKEGTTGGRITGNKFENAGYSGDHFADSWIDVKGNGYTVANNFGTTALTDAIQVHSQMSGWGTRNTFSGNGVVTKVPGYEVNVSSKATGNVVLCKTSGAAKGLSNIACKK